MKRLTWGGLIVILSVVVFILTSVWTESLIYVVRTYEIDGVTYDYTAGDMIFYVGQLVGELLLFWYARMKLRNEKFARCVAQWAIDLISVDIAYCLFTNPYTWSNSKLMCMGIATIMFIIVYYFEYISLWHQSWMGKIKNIYAKYKNKSNGR